MKTILIATIAGLVLSGAALAEKNMKNVQQQEDIIHGYNQAPASPSQAPTKGGTYANQQQQEDQLQGYGKTTASSSEPATVRVGKHNVQQQEDLIHGYSK